ncbi:MAG: alpha-galactosidase [Eubacteriales bacterium]|nr:alpha-galactosidase [Eubacteriales bacterium]
MAVIHHQNTNIFHICNEELSYIIRVMENGQLENLYYGKRIHDREGLEIFHEEEMRPQMTVSRPDPSFLSMHFTKQEYPVYGTGDYRSPAFTVAQPNGSRIVNFTYVSHKIYKGKVPIIPLPATYVEQEDEAETLELLLHDSLINTDLILTYTVYRDYPVITRNTRVCHHGDEPVTLERVMSASVEFPDMDYEMVHLSGAWARERYVKTRKLEMGIQAVQSLCGTCSSADHNPFLALKRPGTNEHQGEVFGFSLVYSGNYLAQIEVTTFDITRVMMGIHPENFFWTLEKGEEFQSPEVVMVYSDSGLNKMSQVYHRLYRTRLARGMWRDRPRPILLNNWEATYFDFNEEDILNIARKAKEVGVELFVLDDGWFGARNDDYRGLGDWYVNMRKLPAGISGLSRKIEELGLKFGFWVELEMVNKDSDLYRAHPDWVIGVPGRYESQARHQHVLDFSRKEVVDYIYEMIEKVIAEASISYIKWDMNRYMSEPFSRGTDAKGQGKFMHRYILGVYDLYRRLTERFPDILFESCASGGARFDPAMLYFAPQTWTSDDTDALERLKIQYGTSYVYPVVSMGSHVSAVPNHQLFRTTSLSTRANVAYFGTFGYELDLNMLSEEELSQVRNQIEFMKEYRELIQMEGDFYRLLNPFEGNDTAWIVVSRDRQKAVAGFYQRLNRVNGAWLRLRLRGLDPDRLYTLEWRWDKASERGDARTASRQVYGSELMYAGIPISREILNQKGGDFASVLFTLS